MDIRSFQGAFVISTIAGTSSLFIQAVDTVTTGEASQLFTSMGVFGAALGIAYFMLRRGDKREHDLLASAREDGLADKRALLEALAVVTSLQNELADLRRRTRPRSDEL